jgi:hypothetical protein
VGWTRSWGSMRRWTRRPRWMSCFLS